MPLVRMKRSIVVVVVVRVENEVGIVGRWGGRFRGEGEGRYALWGRPNFAVR